MTCHASHVEAERQKRIEEKALRLQDSQERLREQQKRDLRIDPRKIRRQHRWAPGTDPSDPDTHPDSGYTYVKVVPESPPSDPDQLDLLHGGPPSGMPCERCGEMTHIVGEMSQWAMMTQPGVEIANRDSITEARKKELQETIICVLACPNCRLKHQWFRDMLPKRE